VRKKNSVPRNQELVGPQGCDGEENDEHQADGVQGDEYVDVVGEVVHYYGGCVEGYVGLR
jgi:hypothetical protein